MKGKGKCPPKAGKGRMMAEGGRADPLEKARTFGEARRAMGSRFEATGGVAGALNRAVQKATRPRREVEELERKAKRSRRALGIDG